MAQIRAQRQTFRQQRQALGRCHQHPHIAVLQYEGDLLGLKQGVDRDEYPPGGRRAKAGDDGLDAFIEVDSHSVSAGQAHCHQATCKPVDHVGELSVADTHACNSERNGMRGSFSGAQYQLRQ